MRTNMVLLSLFPAAFVFFLAACTIETPTPTAPAPNTSLPPTTAPPIRTLVTLVPSQSTPTPPSARDLASKRWVLVSYGPPGAETPVIADTNVTLEFEEGGQAVGSGGCNSFSAQYEVIDGTIFFRQIIHTKIGCLETGVMEQDQSYFDALQSTGAFDLSRDELAISYDNDTEVLNFVRAGTEPTPSPTPFSAELCSSIEKAPESDWNLCISREYGFEVHFPQEGEIVDQTGTSARINLPFIPGTNLTEKYLQIDARETTDDCSSPFAEGYAPGVVPTGTVTINGMEFLKQTGQEGAAGSIYTWEAYSIRQVDTCVSSGFVLRSSQLGAFPTPPPEYDQEAESEIFMEIVSTFAWH